MVPFDYVIGFTKTVTMAEAIFTQYSRSKERCIPSAVCKRRATQKTEKELQPEGNIIFGQISSSLFACGPPRVHHTQCLLKLTQI